MKFSASIAIAALAGSVLANPVAVNDKVERDLEPRVIGLIPIAIPGVPAIPGLPVISVPTIPPAGSLPIPAGDLPATATALAQAIYTVLINLIAGANLPIPLPNPATLFPNVTGIIPGVPTVGAGSLSPAQINALVATLTSLIDSARLLAGNLPGGLNAGQIGPVAGLLTGVLALTSGTGTGSLIPSNALQTSPALAASLTLVVPFLPCPPLAPFFSLSSALWALSRRSSPVSVSVAFSAVFSEVSAASVASAVFSAAAPKTAARSGWYSIRAGHSAVDSV